MALGERLPVGEAERLAAAAGGEGEGVAVSAAVSVKTGAVGERRGVALPPPGLAAAGEAVRLAPPASSEGEALALGAALPEAPPRA